MASFNGFRVVCDLSDFFNDIRSKLLIYIDPSIDRTVADLVVRIKTLAGLGLGPGESPGKYSNILLAIGDCLLPMTESIRVIHQEDILKVINNDVIPAVECVPKTNLESYIENYREKGKKGEMSMGTNEDKVDSDSKTDLKPIVPAGTRVTTVLNATSMKGKMNIGTNENEVDSDSKTDLLPIVPAGTRITTVLNATSTHTSANGNHSSYIEATSEDNNAGGTGASGTRRRRKRTRVRKRRRHSDIITVEPAHANVEDIEEPSVDISEPVFSKFVSKSKHIRFSLNTDHNTEEPYETLNLSNKLPDSSDVLSNVSPQNWSNASTPSRLDVRLQPKVTQWDIKKPVYNSTNNQKAIENGNESNVNTVSDQNSVFGKLLALANSTPLVVKRTKPCNVEVNTVPVAVTPLQGLPKYGDILTFKIWRMDADYCPQISKQITAKVIYCSNSTNEVSFEILDRLDQCQQPRGKFDIESEEDGTEHQHSSIVKFNWNEILEPYQRTL